MLHVDLAQLLLRIMLHMRLPLLLRTRVAYGICLAIAYPCCIRVLLLLTRVAYRGYCDPQCHSSPLATMPLIPGTCVSLPVAIPGVLDWVNGGIVIGYYIHRQWQQAHWQQQTVTAFVDLQSAMEALLEARELANARLNFLSIPEHGTLVGAGVCLGMFAKFKGRWCMRWTMYMPPYRYMWHTHECDCYFRREARWNCAFCRGAVWIWVRNRGKES